MKVGFIMNDPSAVQLKILVVDDDFVNQRMMEVVLKTQGHLVEFASDGLEALEAIKKTRYNMIFMDLQMPVIDGIEASRQIREWERVAGYNTYIVALTASYLPEKGQELFDAGIDNYIAKPFKLEQIKRMLGYSINATPQAAAPTLEAQSEEPKSFEVLNVQAGLECLGGDAEIYATLLRDFLDELPVRLGNLRHYQEIGDLHGLSRAAHNLKGVSANLGAEMLSNSAKRLESQGNAGYTSTLEGLLAEIDLSGSEFEKAGQAFLSTLVLDTK